MQPKSEEKALFTGFVSPSFLKDMRTQSFVDGICSVLVSAKPQKDSFCLISEDLHKRLDKALGYGRSSFTFYWEVPTIGHYWNNVGSYLKKAINNYDRQHSGQYEFRFPQ